MTRPQLFLITLACCAGCARSEPRSAPPAHDSAKSTVPVVAQAGDTTEDDDESLSSDCRGKGDTIQVTGPTIIATVPSTIPVEKDTTTKSAPLDSAARADSIEEAETDGNEADTDFVLMALAACKSLHTGGVTMYVNNDTTRIVQRRGRVSSLAFREEGFVFLDTTGVRHRVGGFLGRSQLLALSDSLFGTKLSRGHER